MAAWRFDSFTVAMSIDPQSDPPALPPEAEWLSLREAAQLLRVDRRTLSDAIQHGEIPGVLRIRRSIRINRQVLVNYTGQPGETVRKGKHPR